MSQNTVFCSVVIDCGSWESLLKKIYFYWPNSTWFYGTLFLWFCFLPLLLNRTYLREKTWRGGHAPPRSWGVAVNPKSVLASRSVLWGARKQPTYLTCCSGQGEWEIWKCLVGCGPPRHPLDTNKPCRGGDRSTRRVTAISSIISHINSPLLAI